MWVIKTHVNAFCNIFSINYYIVNNIYTTFREYFKEKYIFKQTLLLRLKTHTYIVCLFTVLLMSCKVSNSSNNDVHGEDNVLATVDKEVAKDTFTTSVIKKVKSDDDSNNVEFTPPGHFKFSAGIKKVIKSDLSGTVLLLKVDKILDYGEGPPASLRTGSYEAKVKDAVLGSIVLKEGDTIIGIAPVIGLTLDAVHKINLKYFKKIEISLVTTKPKLH